MGVCDLQGWRFTATPAEMNLVAGTIETVLLFRHKWANRSEYMVLGAGTIATAD